MFRAILATIAVIVLGGSTVRGQVLDDFEKKPALAVFQAEQAGATVTFEEAPEAKGLSVKVAWTAVPPKGIMHLLWPDSGRLIVPFEPNNEAGGLLKFVVQSENPQAIRRLEARVKDAKGESFTWGTDVTLEPKKWQEVTIRLRPGTETSRRSDKPGNDNGKFDAPVRLAHLGIVLKGDAEPGNVYLDDLKFETAAPASQPAATP